MKKRALATFPFFSSVIAFIMTGIYLLLRYSFNVDYIVILKVLCASLALINLPYCLYFFFKKDEVCFYSFNIIAIIAIFVVALIAGIFSIPIIIYPILILGIVAFLIALFNYIRIIRFVTIFHLFLLIILCLWLSGVVWQGRILSPLFLEKIVYGFYNTRDLNAGLDNLFHMSLTQMIKTYNIPSTGLDELPYIPYHYGSHFIFAQISKLLDISTINMYHFGFPVIFLPLFFHVVFLVFHKFKELNSTSKTFDHFFWVFLFIIFIGILPIAPEGIAYRTGLAWNSIIASESYLISMIFFLMLLSLIVVPIINERSFKISRTHLFVSILLFIIIGFTKISTLFIFGILFGYLYIRYRLYKEMNVSGKNVMPLIDNNLYKVKFTIRPKLNSPTLFLFFLIIISVSFFYLLFDFQELQNSSESSLSFLHFYKNFISAPFSYFIILHFLWTFFLIFLWISFRIHKIVANTTLRAAILESKVMRLVFYVNKKIKVNPILLELQIVIAVSGFLPGMFLNIAGGSAFYFSDIQHWTALFFIGYYFYFRIQQVEKKNLRLIYSLGFLLIFSAFYNSLYSFTVLLKDNYITRKCILEKTNYDFDRMSTDFITMSDLVSNRSIFYDKDLEKRLTENDDFSKLKFLTSLDNLTQKGRKILYMEDKDFFLKYLPCYKAPFFITATTGISLLDGYSIKSCFWGGWGMELYTRKKAILQNQNLCESLSDPIFKEVVSCNVSMQTYKIVSCKK